MTGYNALQPFQWPQGQGEPATEQRFFAEGDFYTPDRRARLVAVHPANDEATDPRYPFVLNTGRVRDHWHTMTRTGKSARLSGHFAEPFAEIHPLDAAEQGIGDATLVKLTNDHGAIIVRALLTDRQARGNVFVPMHWTGQFASKARVDTLVTANVDPVSGQPALKMANVAVRPFQARWYGFAVMREKPASDAKTIGRSRRTRGGFRLELASCEQPRDWSAFAQQLFRTERRCTAARLSRSSPGSAPHRGVRR